MPFLLKTISRQRNINKLIRRAAILLSVISLGFAIQGGYTINANIAALDGTKFYLSYKSGDKTIVDSAINKDNKFILSANFPEAVICTLSNSANHQIRLFFGENSAITISGNIGAFNAVSITGSRENERWTVYKNASYNVIGRFRETVKATGGNLHDKSSNTYIALSNSKDSLTEVFIKANPNSNVTAWAVLDSYVTNPDKARAEKFYLMLSPQVRQSSYGKKIASFYNAGRTIAIGLPAPDFALKDATGKTVRFSDYKGSFVFVDFWASWCGPCRQENPEIVKCYKTYGSAHLKFLSISMDASAESWKTALATDKLSWTQLNDPESTQGHVADLYGIKSLPFNLVIDPDGNIIATNLRGQALLSFLAKNFKGNKP